MHHNVSARTRDVIAEKQRMLGRALEDARGRRHPDLGGER
jgi:hypothetical protein